MNLYMNFKNILRISINLIILTFTVLMASEGFVLVIQFGIIEKSAYIEVFST